jgi:hypothetical protein
MTGFGGGGGGSWGGTGLTERSSPIGPNLPCEAPNKSLVPCGLTEITFTEQTADTEGKPFTRSFTRRVQSTSLSGHAPLVLEVQMTAPPQRTIDIMSRSVVLSASGPGPHDPSHLKWKEKGLLKDGAVLDLEVQAGKTPIKAFNQSMTHQRRSMRSRNKDGAAAAAAVGQGVVLVSGIGVLFDALTGLLRRKSRSLTIEACGNPATSTAASGRVDLTIYRRETFEFELTIPLMSKGASYENTYRDGAPGEWGDASEGLTCKLTIDDADSGYSETFEADLSKIEKLIRGVLTLQDTITDLLDNVPKVGVVIEGEIFGPAGVLTVALQWRENQDETVSLGWSVKCDLRLIKAEFELKYGAEFRDCELSVGIEFEGEVSLTLAGGSTQKGWEGPTSRGRTILIPMEGKLDVSLLAIADAIVVAAKAGAKFPLKWPGQVEIDLAAPGMSGNCDFTLGDLTLEPITVFFDLTVLGIIETNYKHQVTKKSSVIVEGSL